MATKRVPPKKIAAKKAVSKPAKKSAKVVYKPAVVRPSIKALAKAATDSAAPRRAAFVKAVAAGKSATAAAKAAGYSERSAHAQGHRLLKDAELQKAVVHERNRVAHELGIDAAFVLNNIRALAKTNITNYDNVLAASTSAELSNALKELPEDLGGAIQEVTVEHFPDFDNLDKKGKPGKGVRVKLKLSGHKLAANEQLGKHISLHGFGTSKVELTGKDGGAMVSEHSIRANVLTEQQLELIAAGLPLEAGE